MDVTDNEERWVRCGGRSLPAVFFYLHRPNLVIYDTPSVVDAGSRARRRLSTSHFRKSSSV